jgi:hypothetical protein
MHNKSPDDLGTRRDRLMHEHIHDPYKTPQKLPEPTLCPDCGAVFHKGHWQWITPPPENAHRTRCQACHRTHDKYPAGVITLSGGYVRTHRAELVQMARNREAEEKQAHPLHRIMSLEETPDSLVIKTTDIHLPRLIADALRHAHHGEPQIQYDKEGYFARVDWQREK